jgi:hypothetical protein
LGEGGDWGVREEREKGGSRVGERGWVRERVGERNEREER